MYDMYAADKSLQHAATRCNTLQHAATRCNTLQHAATHKRRDESALLVFSGLAFLRITYVLGVQFRNLSCKYACKLCMSEVDSGGGRESRRGHERGGSRGRGRGRNVEWERKGKREGERMRERVRGWNGGLAEFESSELFCRRIMRDIGTLRVRRIETLHHTVTHYNTLQPTQTHRNTLQHTSTHCNTLQHTAPHCTTLQHTAPRRSTDRI